MARKGDEGSDYRSEAERIGPRADRKVQEQISSTSGSNPAHVIPVHPLSASREHMLTKGGGEHTLTPDKALQEQIVSRLSMEPEASTSQIIVEVKDGSVSLSGSADTINAKYRIEELTKRIQGVQCVENNLSVRIGEALEEFTRNTDAARLREGLARGSKLTE